MGSYRKIPVPVIVCPKYWYYLQCQWSIDSVCVGLGLFGMIDVNALSYSLKLVDCLWKEIVLACRKRLYYSMQEVGLLTFTVFSTLFVK